MQKIALIPSYEPDYRLKDLVIELNKNNFTIVVVNDGSSDKYNEIFNSIKSISKVLEYDKNMGKGYALKYGLKYIKSNFDNYVLITMDSDGQHTVRDADKLCKYTIDHPNELVIGKRIRSSKTPIRSRIGNSITKSIYHIATGVKVYDTQTGLRCFTNRLIDFNLSIEGYRYEYEMNVLLYAPKEGIKITEIEIETIYIDNNSGSHFNTLKDSFKVYKEIIKFSLSSIISFIIDYMLYMLFIIFIGNITLSNVLARIISSTINYSINRNVVFKNKRKVTNTFVEYSILAFSILILNTILLNIIIKIGINIFIAKILVEKVLFILSWNIQRRKIFKKERIYEETCRTNI